MQRRGELDKKMFFTPPQSFSLLCDPTLISETIIFCFILRTHEESHREVYQEFQPGYDIVHRSGAKGCLDHWLHAPLAYTAQLPTLHQHRANNQYRTANQI